VAWADGSSDGSVHSPISSVAPIEFVYVAVLTSTDHALGLGRVIEPLHPQSAAECRRFDHGCRSTLVLDRSVAEAWKSYDLVHILRRAPDGQS